MFFCKHVFVAHTFMHAVFLIQTSVFDNVGNVTVSYDTCIAYIKELNMNANCRVDVGSCIFASLVNMYM